MGKTIQFLLIITLLVLSLGAFGQSDSRYDAGLNLPFNQKAGDVNPQTGNLTISAADLSLPGRAGMNFSFSRVWSLNQSNAYNMNRGTGNSNYLSTDTNDQYNHLGIGWNASLPYIFSIGDRKNLYFNGNVYELESADQLAIYDSKRSHIQGYDLLDLRVYSCSEADLTISYASFGTLPEGVDNIKTGQSKYVLILKDNSRYYFDIDGNLMMQQDRSGLNKIWYFNTEIDNKSYLKLVVDTVGRHIQFAYDENKNLSTISWKVKIGQKNADGSRSYSEVDRSISYKYENAETLYPEVADLISGDQNTYLLTGVTDVAGNLTRYEYEAGLAQYSFDADSVSDTNAYLMLTRLSTMADPNDPDTFKTQRCFEYQLTNEDKKFHNGYMEFYKISRQYMKDINRRTVGDTYYQYFEPLAFYPNNEYSSEITIGNVTTSYVYTLSTLPAKEHVLDRVEVNTVDGFDQVTEYTYTDERAIRRIDVRKQEQDAYSEKFSYDKKGNLTEKTDRRGLKTMTEYDDDYSIPVKETRILDIDGVSVKYITGQTVNILGQVTEQYFYEVGKNEKINSSLIEYDSYGNVTSQTDAKGYKTHITYDADKLFPVKTWQTLTRKDWNDKSASDFWISEPDPGVITEDIRTWKVFNTDGTLWMEVDNEGYAIEHYYDAYSQEIETVMPDGDAGETAIIAGNPDDIYAHYLSSHMNYFTLRNNNPGSRVYIDYRNDFIHTVADVDKSPGVNTKKVSSVQNDGLGNALEQVEYKVLANFDENDYDPEIGFKASFLATDGGSGLEINAVKTMTYDTLGRMVALTDPDADVKLKDTTIHETEVEVYDKTWIVKYDDLGRQKSVEYPKTMADRASVKRMTYDDMNNWVTTTDPEGRTVVEKKDWNDNLVELVHQGDNSTAPKDYQVYKYDYDKLNRKIRFTDPKGIVTTYHYNERDLLVKQGFGETGSDFMEYNELGQLIKKTDCKGHVIGFVYDELGRNIEVNHYKDVDEEDEDTTSTIEYTVKTIYDFRGNPIRIDNQNLIEYYIYDYANRVTSLERHIKTLGINELITDRFGENQFENNIFKFSYTYNDAGMVTQMENPDGSKTNYSYEPQLAQLSGIQDGSEEIVSSLSYNKSGVVEYMKWGNEVEQTWDFDNRKRISHITISNPADSLNPLADMTYTLNGSGDILNINQNEYRYDGFDRLVYASTLLPGQKDYRSLVRSSFGTKSGNNPYEFLGETRLYNPEADLNDDGVIDGWDHAAANFIASDSVYDVESFSYDKNGNRTTLTQNGDEYVYHYGDRNRLEKITLTKKGEMESRLYVEYTYDLNGNTTKRTIYKSNDEIEVIEFDYDGMNRLVKTTKSVYPGDIEVEPTTTESTVYFYDNAGNRFIKQDGKGTTIYLRHGQIAVAMDIELPSDISEEKAVTNRYILSGDLLAGRVTSTLKADDSIESETFYYHLDHLNSTKAVTDENGEVVVIYEYRAFGEQLKRLDASGDDTGDEAKYSFGGKELDDESNLYYFNARYYDATIGRFINVDPIQDGSNWYVYCSNNPLGMVDPTGLDPDKIENDYDKLYDNLTKDIDNQNTSYENIFRNNSVFYNSTPINESGPMPDGTTLSISGTYTYFGLNSGGNVWEGQSNIGILRIYDIAITNGDTSNNYVFMQVDFQSQAWGLLGLSQEQKADTYSIFLNNNDNSINKKDTFAILWKQLESNLAKPQDILDTIIDPPDEWGYIMDHFTQKVWSTGVSKETMENIEAGSVLLENLNHSDRGRVK